MAKLAVDRLAGVSLDDNVRELPGIGPTTAEAFSKLRVETVYDLVMLTPRRYEDRTRLIPIRDCRAIGEMATIRASIRSIEHRRAHASKKPLVEVRLEDESGHMDVTLFNPRAMDDFKLGEEVLAYGRIQRRRTFSLADPTIEPWPENGAYEKIVPVYPGNAGIAPKAVGRFCRQFIPHFAGRVPDPIPPSVCLHASLMPLEAALKTVHLPGDQPSLEMVDEAFQRLVFTELFLMELVLWSWRRVHSARHTVEPLHVPARAHNRALARLPFEPTDAQLAAFAQVAEDLGKHRQMMRLLQGDVGVGKTAVAFYAALMGIAAGVQVAMVAPTEILASQHYRTFRRQLEGSSVTTAILTGSTRSRQRERVRSLLKSGKCNVVVGTHALLEDDVQFENLRLVIVDEQQKFGVIQRQRLVEKGANPHVLAMTATPIPRTLAMTVFGDLDLTVITERPPNRPGYVTQFVPDSRIDLVFALIRDRAVRGQRTYVICPKVTSKKQGTWTVKELGERLRSGAVLGEGIEVGVLHGGMSGPVKEQVMMDFARGRKPVLVASTVVEIGVDVPEATLMVVLDCDQLGLSQLHQLRGRISRGEHLGTCLLVTAKHSPAVLDRLRVLVRTDDGFEIAEEDLRLRGPGELFSTQQAGTSMRLRFASMSAEDVPTLLRCRDEVVELARLEPIETERYAVMFERHFGEPVDTLLSAS